MAALVGNKFVLEKPMSKQAQWLLACFVFHGVFLCGFVVWGNEELSYSRTIVAIASHYLLFCQTCEKQKERKHE